MDDGDRTLHGSEQDLHATVKRLLDALYAPYGWTGHTLTMLAINAWKGGQRPGVKSQEAIYEALSALSTAVGWEPGPFPGDAEARQAREGDQQSGSRRR